MSRNIALIGGDSQVGTTMTAQALAEDLGAKGDQVLLVMASGKAGDDYFANKEGKSIDDVKANLINGHMDSYELRQALIREKNIWILPGVKDSISAAYYNERSMRPLATASEDMDHVIFDCGNELRLGLVISAVDLCAERYFVLTQQEKTLRRFGDMKERILDPLDFNGKIIVNKHQNNVSLLTPNEIGRQFSMEVAASIPYVEYGWQAEIERQTLMGTGRYSKAIGNLSDIIRGERTENSSWIRNLILKNT